MSLWMWTVALIPGFFFAVSNLLDKKAVHGTSEDGNPWAIVVMGAVFDLVVCVPVALLCFATGRFPSTETFWPMFANGAVFTLAGWLFYRCIRTEDASRVVPIFQTIPAFGLFLGFYGLEEKLNFGTVLAIILLMVGGYSLSVVRGRIMKNILVAMLLSSVLYALNDYIVAEYGRRELETSETGDSAVSVANSLPVIFADLLGKMVFGLTPLLSRRTRSSFAHGFKSKFRLVAGSSLTYTAGDIGFDIAKLFAPLALVQALCCTQPLFVLVGAVLLTKYCKDFPKEEIDRNTLILKAFGITLMVAGGVLLSI